MKPWMWGCGFSGFSVVSVGFGFNIWSLTHICGCAHTQPHTHRYVVVHAYICSCVHTHTHIYAVVCTHIGGCAHTLLRFCSHTHAVVRQHTGGGAHTNTVVRIHTCDCTHTQMGLCAHTCAVVCTNRRVARTDMWLSAHTCRVCALHGSILGIYLNLIGFKAVWTAWLKKSFIIYLRENALNKTYVSCGSKHSLFRDFFCKT